MELTKSPVEGEFIPVDASLKSRKKVIRRDAWDEQHRGVPADIIRSGLFRVNPPKERELLQREAIGSIDGHVITYSGQELSMADDWKIIKQLIHLQKGWPIEDGFDLAKGQFVKEVFGNTSGVYYQKLYDSLTRMSEGTLKFVSKDKSVSINGVGLVRKFRHRDEATEKELAVWHVWLEPEIISLLEREIAITERIDSNKLTPQAIKIRDVIENTDPSRFLLVETLRVDILQSKASAASFRKTLLGRMSNQLLDAGIISEKLRIDANGVLLYKLAGREQPSNKECQLRLFNEP